MATKKVTKKELKQPDQFVGFWQIASARLGQFAAKNAKVLAGKKPKKSPSRGIASEKPVPAGK